MLTRAQAVRSRPSCSSGASVVAPPSEGEGDDPQRTGRPRVLPARPPTGALAPENPQSAVAAATAARRLRTVEQAVHGIEAYLQLAAHQPTTPSLPTEEQRARALWQTLLDLASLWPDHPDHPGPSTSPARPAA